MGSTSISEGGPEPEDLVICGPLGAQLHQRTAPAQDRVGHPKWITASAALRIDDGV